MSNLQSINEWATMLATYGHVQAKEVLELIDDHIRLLRACDKNEHEIEQLLAQAIGGFPWYKDDQGNFPGANESNGVCVGEHTAATLAALAASEIARLKRGDFTPDELQNLCHHRDEAPGCTPTDFFEGCTQYQRKLFAKSAVEEERNKTIENIVAQISSCVREPLASELIQMIRNPSCGKRIW